MNVGLACQFMSTEKVDIESLEMQEYIQDALDLIEYANGDVTTEWERKEQKWGIQVRSIWNIWELETSSGRQIP